MYTVNELLKTTQLNILQNSLRYMMQTKKLIVKHSIENDLAVPYNEEIKKMSQVIGMAYGIASKIYVGLKNNYTIKEILDTDARLKYDIVSKAIKYFDDRPILGLDPSYIYDTYHTAVTQKTMSIPDIAKLSVLLAWIKSFNRSGKWPVDTTLIIPSNTKYKLIQQEVNKLLNSSIDILDEISKAEDLVINPTYVLPDLEIYDGADFLASKIMYIFTTSGIRYNNQLAKLKGLAALNDYTKQFEVDKVEIYFPRFKDSYQYDIEKAEEINE